MSMNNKTNCPNCGAAFQHLYNHRCPYCKTMLDFRVEEVDEIDPRYIRNAKLVSFDRDLMSGYFKLLFEGIYISYPQALEFKDNNNVICIDANYHKPKKVFMSIYIKEKDFFELIQNERFDILSEYLPFEMDKECFIEAIMKNRKDIHR